MPPYIKLPMDITQITLLAVIVVLTIFVVVIGFQVFFLIRDLRKTLTRTNHLLDDADSILTSIKKPIEGATSVLSAMTAGVGIAHLLKRFEKKK